MPTYAAESKRLVLQPLNIDEHLDDFHLMMSTPEAMAWSTRAPHDSLAQSHSAILDNLPSAEEPWHELFAILLKPSTQNKDENENSKNENNAENVNGKHEKYKFIGVIGTVREADVAYKLHPSFWRKGYMSEALPLFVSMFWNMPCNAKYDKLIAGADPENPASIKTLLRAGFEKGECVKDFYERTCQPGLKSDMQFFYLNRPRTEIEENPAAGEKTPEVDEVKLVS